MKKISEEQITQVLDLARTGKYHKRQIAKQVNLSPASVWKLCHANHIKLLRAPKLKKRGPYKLRSREDSLTLRPVSQIERREPKAVSQNVTEIILELLIAREQGLIGMDSLKTILNALTR